MKLLKNTNMNEYFIKLIVRKELFYGPIYAFSLVELEILKIYIKINLKTEFIQPSKFLAGAFILFNKKSDSSFCLRVNY